MDTHSYYCTSMRYKTTPCKKMKWEIHLLPILRTVAARYCTHSVIHSAAFFAHIVLAYLLEDDIRNIVRSVRLENLGHRLKVHCMWIVL